MARLSVEHHAAAASMTPDKSRKPSRLRDIFKSRSSTSPNVETAKMKSSPATSPVASTPLKPGFEQVGLLPSERTSLADAKHDLEINHGGNVLAALATQEKDLLDISANNGVEQEVGGIDTDPQDEQVKKNKQAEKSNRTSSLVEVFQEELKKRQDEHLHVIAEPIKEQSPVRVKMAKERDARMSSELTSTELDFLELDGDDDDGTSRYDSKRHSQTGNGMFAALLDQDDTFVGIDEDMVPLVKSDSFASNIFDNNDALSKGIREYVASRIAEAMVEQDRKQHERVSSTPKTLHFTLELRIQGSDKHNIPHERAPARPSLHSVDDTCLGRCLQLAVMAIYTILALTSIFNGPLAFLAMLIKVLCLLSIYVFARAMLGLATDAQADALLRPVFAVSLWIVAHAKQALLSVAREVVTVAVDAAVKAP